MELKVHTYNVNGLGDSEKRDIFFSMLARPNWDILLLQETHIDPSLMPFLNKIYKGNIFASFDPVSPSSRNGVAILTTDKIKVQEVKVLVEGRCMMITIEYESELLDIFNVYAPSDNCQANRARFFQSLPVPSSRPCIWGGDFNCVENPLLDRINCSERTLSPGTSYLLSFIGKHDLSDPWRRANPEDQDATWHSNRHTRLGTRFTAARLDRFYLGTGLINRSTCQIRHDLNFLGSDHSPVTLTICPTKPVERGKGAWILNNSILNDHMTRSQVVDLLHDANDSRSSFPDIGSWWDWTKYRLKQLLIQRSTDLSRQKRMRTGSLLTLMNAAKDKWLENPSDVRLENSYFKAKERLDHHLRYQIQGQMIRSKVRHLNHGERPTKYFASLEKTQQSDRLIDGLRDGQGTVYQDTDGMLGATADFYKDLYSEDLNPSRSDHQHLFFNSLPEKKLSLSDLNDLDRPLTLQELSSALKSMQNNKSPGLDGLTVEFYKAFWPTLGPMLLHVAQEAFIKGELPRTMTRGAVSLLHKKGDRRNLTNWRPISLLQIDQKLISKALASRLSPILSRFLSPDQTMRKGGWIMDAILDVQAYYDWSSKTDDPSGVLFLDFTKAFDRVNHDFMHRVLEHYGFGPNFKRWVRILYQDATSYIKINGFFTEPIPIKRGVRQGDALSPLLFNLCVETLADAIKSSNAVGVQVPGMPKLQVVQYADDLTLFFSSPQDLETLLETLSLYCSASDSHVNLSKSSGFSHGIDQTVLQRIPVTWLPNNHCLKYLGAYVGSSVEENVKAKVDSTVKEIEQIATRWSKRSLSLIGRVAVANTFMNPLIAYWSTPAYLDEKSLNRLRTAVFNFVWQGKRDRLKRSLLVNPKTRGGLNLQCPTLTIKTAKCRLVQRSIRQPDRFWAIQLQQKLDLIGAKWGLTAREILCSRFPFHTSDLPSRWTQSLKYWQELNPRLPVDKLSQPLYHNPHLTDESGRPFKDKKLLNLVSRGIVRTQNLVSQNGVVLLPKEVRKIFGTNVRSSTLAPLLQSVKRFLDSGVGTPTREFNWAANASSRSIRSVLSSTDHTSITYKSLPEVRIRKHQSTLYLFRHQGLPMGEWLAKRMNALPDCPHCHQPETFTHMVSDCTVADQVWEKTWHAFRRRHALSGSQPPALAERTTGRLAPPRDRWQREWTPFYAAAVHALWVLRCNAWHQGEVNPTSALSRELFLVSLLEKNK